MTRPKDADKLVAHIHQSQDRECRQVLEQASEQVDRLVASAWRSARRRVHETVARERELLAREETLAAARLHTAQRTHVQRRQQALLSQAMQHLENVLAQQWLERDAAGAWIRRACDAARESLPAGEWELVHGESWTAMHEGVCRDLLAARGDPVWHDSVDPRIEAGLRVKCKGVVVDATLRSLLDDRQLQAELLGALGVESCEVVTSDE